MASIRQWRAGLFLTVAGGAFILFITLFPTPDHADTAAGTRIWCLVCGELGMVDVTLNVILFIPLGLGLGLLDVPWRRALLIVGFTTLTIEVLQLSVVAGRDASLSDLITNTMGGAVGLALARHWRRIFFLPPRPSLAVAVLAAAAWLLIQGFTAFALQRVLPRTVYFGQWAAELGQFEKFTGRVVSVRLDTLPLPSTRLARSDRVRAMLLAPGSVLEVRAISGGPTSDVAPIFSIFDDRQREILLLGQEGRDLIFRVRTRTGPLGLRTPALRLADALPDGPGIPIELRASHQPGHYQLGAEIGGEMFRRDMALSASWGWTLLLPFDHAFGSEMPWLTMVWVGGLLLPIGYYAGRRRVVQRSVALAMLIALLAAGLILIPMIAGFAAVQPLEWVAGIAGGVSGFWLADRASRLEQQQL